MNRLTKLASNQALSWLLLALVILAAAAVRFHLLDVPLERDEGEYAYAGQLLLQGIAPYAQVYNMKMPGIYATYALVMSMFGETHVGIHLGLLLVNAATTLLLFLLVRRLFDGFTAVAAAACFAFLSLGQPVQGIFANAEHFVLLPAIGGILLLARGIESGRCPTLFIAALLLGLAFLMKQHAVFFIAFGGLYLLLEESRKQPFSWRRVTVKGLLYLAGVTLPFLLTCLLLYRAGVFDKFWFWTFDYAREYVSSMPWSTGMRNLALHSQEIIGSSLLMWLVAILGLASFTWRRRGWLFVLLFAVSSFLAVTPGLYFRSHYFVLLLPAVALLFGVGATALRELLKKLSTQKAAQAIPVVLVLLTLAHGAWQQRDFLFRMEPDEILRSTYDLNPFPESPEIARYLQENTDEGDRIAVVGSEPQIYFYANRRSATGHIYTYPMMQDHPHALPMQREMIDEIERARPSHLVFANVPTSWLMTKRSEKLIFEWVAEYTRKHYEKVGVVDIGHNGTNYVWGEDARRYRVQSSASLSVFRRVN
ncbi:MAG: glycosyltransferase family 39 protein [Lysobacterales bacterium]|jgi:hypothetical protein